MKVHCEDTNSYNPYTVATSRDGNIGHILIRISKSFMVFLHHGGRISCEITGSRIMRI